jgi:hypothetical protein
LERSLFENQAPLSSTNRKPGEYSGDLRESPDWNFPVDGEAASAEFSSESFFRFFSIDPSVPFLEFKMAVVALDVVW